MPKQIVRNALVRYEEDGKRRFAFQGQEIEISAEVSKKLGDQLYPEGKGPDTEVASEPGAAPVDLDSGSTEDVAAWLRGDAGDKPKASEIVEAAEGDVDRAVLLLDAEQSLDSEPRKTVVEGLRKIIDGDGGS